MNKITYKTYTLGCKVNQYDTSSLSSRLAGFDFSETEKHADLAIVNTCAVTKTAISKAKRTLTLARKENPNAKIVLMGCWPKAYKNELDDFAVDLLWLVGGHEELAKEIAKLFAVPVDYSFSHTEKIAKTDKSRYFIKVQDGCEQFCTYCVIPYTRGKIKSRDKEDIIKEVEAAIKNGFEEIVLSGIHLGLYGTDKGSSLFDLLKDLVSLPGKFRLRLSSIEVGEVSEEIIGLMKKSSKICNHLHIPLQSGNDKVLEKMNRPYLTTEFSKKLKYLRLAIPDIAISTDVIVGFPGETDEDFEITKNFVTKMKFTKLHVFPFSAHEKTPAFSFSDQVSSNDKKKRAKALRELGEKLASEYQQKFWQGKTDEICIEKTTKDIIIGLSEHYLQVECKKSDVKENNLKPGMLTRVKIKKNE